MDSPQDFFVIDNAGSAGKEGKRDHSHKQVLLGALMASSYKSELNRIRSGKYSMFGGSCLVEARK